MSSGSTHRIFQLRMDPLTGDSEWVVIEDQHSEEEEEYDNEVQVFNNSQQPLLATTSYLDMLNDTPRNKAFRDAIHTAVTKPCHVLDIGGGTGLLSMMAVRAMGSCELGTSVTCCESYLPMVKLMKRVLSLNGLQNRIKVINKRSDELVVGVDMPCRANVLVSEILDSELLGEGLIPTLQHAHDNLLVQNPKTVPYRATTYGQFIESDYLSRLHDLYSNETKASDGIYLVPNGLDNILGVKPQQYAFQCNALEKEIKFLSEPFKIFEFDFWKRPESSGEIQLSVKAINCGRIDAVISWWVLQLDCEGTIFYSTAPRWINFPINQSNVKWCDHWKQCIWFVPTKGMTVTKNEDVIFQATHNEISISYNFNPQSRDKDGDFKEENSQLVLSPERIGIYNDSEFRSLMSKAIRKLFEGKIDPLSMIADDSVFLTILVANVTKMSKIVSLFPGLRYNGLRYLKTVSNANGFSMERVQLLKVNEMLSSFSALYTKKVDFLIGEPFYYGTESALPWHNLRFWKERTRLSSVLSKDVQVMPCKGILKACAMSLPDLWNSRCCLDQIEGFDHSVVNTTVGACGKLPKPQEGPSLPYFVWQCGEYKKLSQIVTIMEFDLSKPISQCNGKSQVEFVEPGICHGFVLWIDWVLDQQNLYILSTGPDKRYWKQGVKLLAEPVKVGTLGSTETRESGFVLEASFEPSNGELVVDHFFLS